jgi:nucleotide-binding universal stress UspA family protein
MAMLPTGNPKSINMKTIIISDLKSSSKSILTYGLELARAMESEVDVVHVIDPRISQAKYSSYSDSQSLTPDQPMGYPETLNKEVTLAQNELNELLNTETSRLNYPVKVNVVVEEGSLEEKVEKMVDDEPYCIVVVSAEPDGYHFESKSEIYSMVKDSGAMTILVPPGVEFKEYRKILHPVDFSAKELEKYADLGFFFDAFDPLVHAVTVSRDSDYSELELKSETWKKIANDVFLPAKIRTNVLKGDDFTETLVQYSNRNDYEMIMLFQRKVNAFKKNFKSELAGTFIERTNLPVLFFYRK